MVPKGVIFAAISLSQKCNKSVISRDFVISRYHNITRYHKFCDSENPHRIRPF